MRPPRPWPSWRRAMSRSSASRSSWSPAGIPSTIATSPGPCDSPAVVKRNAVIGGKAIGGPRAGCWRRWPRKRSAAGGGAHRVDVGFAPGPDRERERALLDEDLEPVDGGRAGGLGGGEDRARLLAVGHVDDQLPGLEAVRRQRQVPPRVLALQADCGGVDDQVVV